MYRPVEAQLEVPCCDLLAYYVKSVRIERLGVTDPRVISNYTIPRAATQAGVIHPPATHGLSPLLRPVLHTFRAYGQQ